MWSCPRCGARNGRDAEHCGRCGMPNPFEDGGTTKTIDIPPVEPEPPARRAAALPWAAVIAVVLVALGALVLIVIVLAG